MIKKMTKDLVGKWLVYYGASGFAASYGKIIDVNKKDKYFTVIDGISRERTLFGRHNVVLFETEKLAAKEYKDWQV